MRHENWQTRLSTFLTNIKQKPFDFPNWNCMVYACEAAETICGIDYSKEYKGKIKTEKAAAKMLRKIDKVKTAEAFFEKHFGEQKAVAFARPGDIVFAEPGMPELDIPCGDMFGLIPGVCYGQVSYFLGETGLVEIPTLQLRSAIWVS